MVSKYDGLGTHLRRQAADRIPMTFGEIERATGVRLPEKSQHSRAWWSNNPGNNVMTKVWLDAGFQTAEVDMKARKVVFVRSGAQVWNPPQPAYTPEEWAEAEKAMEADRDQIAEGIKGGTDDPSDKPPSRHPAHGAMKGMFKILPSHNEETEMKGMEDAAQEYAPKEALPDHPIFGCMKGTFWIDPEWDPSKPALDPDELAEWEASIDRKFSALARDLSKK